MKKIIAIALLGLSSLGYSQVIIGDATGTATDKTSVLLEFSKSENKGVILPYVTDLPSAGATATPGTILLDASDATKAKVVYRNASSWVDLSSGLTADVSALLGVQNSETESPEAKAIIGATTSVADGVLVLESEEKAMVLPQVASTDDIVNPSAGMMVYLTDDKLLAVFNGAKWTFWKPTS